MSEAMGIPMSGDGSEAARMSDEALEVASAIFPPEALVLMVSGGSDSTAMCLLASELADSGVLDRQIAVVLHIDHGLRGADSDGDVLFVERLADLCRFRFESRRIDIPSRSAEFDGNMECTARNMRYELAFELLDTICRQRDLDPSLGRVWTAHTLDDRAETFFMRTIVGTGPGGLASVRRRNGRVERPVIRMTRESLRRYIASRIADLGWRLDDPERAQVPGGIWREDSTNADTTGFRAFVRHELMPVAASRNPELLQTMTRTMELIEEEDSFVQSIAERVESKIAVPGPRGSIGIDVAAANELDPVIARRVVYSLCRKTMLPSARIGRHHVDAIVQGLSDPTFSIDLPGGVRVRAESGTMVFGAGRREVAPDDDPLEAGVEIPIPGSVEVPAEDGRSIVLIAESLEVAAGEDPVEVARRISSGRVAVIDLDSARRACAESGMVKDGVPYLLATRRRPGDRLRPIGMGGKSRKLSDILIDRKIPRSARDDAVVIRVGDAIVWVSIAGVVDVGFAAADSPELLKIRLILR